MIIDISLDMNTLNRTMKKIVDTLSDACHVPIREVCVLDHDDKHFKAYVHGTNWFGENVYKKIMKTWNVSENNINIYQSPKQWWTFGSTGYVIEVVY